MEIVLLKVKLEISLNSQLVQVIGSYGIPIALCMWNEFDCYALNHSRKKKQRDIFLCFVLRLHNIAGLISSENQMHPMIGGSGDRALAVTLFSKDMHAWTPLIQDFKLLISATSL